MKFQLILRLIFSSSLFVIQLFAVIPTATAQVFVQPVVQPNAQPVAQSVALPIALPIAPQCYQVAPLSYVAALPATDFKASAQQMLSQLLAKGYRHFGQLDLVQFAQSIQSTNIRYVPALKFLQVDGSERASACWDLQNGQRTINVSLWMWARTDSSMRPVIAMHEFLGPAQFNDQDYQLSSAMALLATEESSGLLEPEQIPSLHALKKIPSLNSSVGHLGRQAFASAGGGVIGVGGGGDWVAALAKLVFLKSGLDHLRQARSPSEKQAAIQEILQSQTGWTVEAQWR